MTTSDARLDYRALLERDDNDTFLVTFPDFDEAHTFGETKEEALLRAQDALATVIEAYIKDRRPLPAPSEGPGALVPVPALIVAKMELHDAMLHAKVTKSELARRLDVHLPQVDRLLDIHHESRLDQIDRAMRALGQRLVLSVRPLNQPLIKIRAARARPSGAAHHVSRKAAGSRRSSRR
jgi:antitoxin HicB